MNIAKKIVLYLLVLAAFCICGTVVMTVYEVLLKMDYDNVWIAGFKVGFAALIGVILNEWYHHCKSKKSGNDNSSTIN